MSDMDAYESDMGWLSKLSDEEIEAVLAGDYAGEDASLRDLAAFTREAKATLAAAQADVTRAAHLAAIAEAAAEIDRAPVSAPKSAASRLLRRVRLVFSSLFASLIAKVALVGVALAATTGGLAATGSLPDPAQEALARASERVGFELPTGDDSEEGEDEAGVPDELPEGTEGSSAPSVLEVIRSWGDDRGCEFGHAVAAAAGGDPGPCEDKQGGDDEGSNNGEGRPEGAGKPEGVGKPEGAGKPEGTPAGKPAGAGEGQGKPEGTPSSKPEGAGKPEGTPGGSQPETDGSGAGNADRAGNSSGNSGAGAPSGSAGGNDNGGGPPSFVPGD